MHKGLIKYAIHINFIFFWLCINSAYGDVCDRLFRDSKSTSTALVRTSPTKSLTVPNGKNAAPGFWERQRRDNIKSLIGKNPEWQKSLENLFKLHEVSSNALKAYVNIEDMISKNPVFLEANYYIFEGGSERLQGTAESPIQRYYHDIRDDLAFIIIAARSVNYQVESLLENLRSSRTKFTDKRSNALLAKCFEPIDTFLQATHWQLPEETIQLDKNPLLEAAGFYRTFEPPNVEIHVARFEELIIERLQRINQKLDEMKKAYASIPTIKAELEAHRTEIDRYRIKVEGLAGFDAIVRELNRLKAAGDLRIQRLDSDPFSSLDEPKLTKAEKELFDAIDAYEKARHQYDALIQKTQELSRNIKSNGPLKNDPDVVNGLYRISELESQASELEVDMHNATDIAQQIKEFNDLHAELKREYDHLTTTYNDYQRIELIQRSPQEFATRLIMKMADLERFIEENQEYLSSSDSPYSILRAGVKTPRGVDFKEYLEVDESQVGSPKYRAKCREALNADQNLRALEKKIKTEVETHKRLIEESTKTREKLAALLKTTRYDRSVFPLFTEVERLMSIHRPEGIYHFREKLKDGPELYLYYSITSFPLLASIQSVLAKAVTFIENHRSSETVNAADAEKFFNNHITYDKELRKILQMGSEGFLTTGPKYYTSFVQAYSKGILDSYGDFGFAIHNRLKQIFIQLIQESAISIYRQSSDDKIAAARFGPSVINKAIHAIYIEVFGPTKKLPQLSFVESATAMSYYFGKLLDIFEEIARSGPKILPEYRELESELERLKKEDLKGVAHSDGFAW